MGIPLRINIDRGIDFAVTYIQYSVFLCLSVSLSLFLSIYLSLYIYIFYIFLSRRVYRLSLFLSFGLAETRLAGYSLKVHLARKLQPDQTYRHIRIDIFGIPIGHTRLRQPHFSSHTIFVYPIL